MNCRWRTQQELGICIFGQPKSIYFRFHLASLSLLSLFFMASTYIILYRRIRQLHSCMFRNPDPRECIEEFQRRSKFKVWSWRISGIEDQDLGTVPLPLMIVAQKRVEWGVWYYELRVDIMKRLAMRLPRIAAGPCLYGSWKMMLKWVDWMSCRGGTWARDGYERRRRDRLSVVGEWRARRNGALQTLAGIGEWSCRDELG